MYANDVDIGGTATFTNLATTGNATIGGTLGVTGATTQTGKLTVNNVIEQHGDGIELYYSTPHIDFHYGNSTADFTSRIIENDSGILTITPKFSTPNATITTGNITTLNTNTISNAGAIVTRDMEVVDTLKSYKWDISHVANLANDFTVSPTLQLASGATIQFSAINTSTKVCTFTVTDSSSISSDSLGGVTWTQYSKVKFTMNLNDVVNSNCDGYLTVKMNSTAGTLVISGTLDDVTGLATGTNYNAEGATIMLYEVGAGSQSTTYPVGIRMTAYGSNKRSYIDIYGGTSTSSWTTPHVRIGNVGGLTFNGETLANQWGIYTDRGYFSGAIVSTEGKIGGFDIGQTNIRNAVISLTDSSHTGIYLGTDGIRNYNTTGSKHVTIKDGTITANSVDLTGAIKATSGFIGQNATNGFTISNTAIYNPSTKSSLGSDTVDGVYVGKDGIALGKGVFKVTSTGAVTASNITATGGTIGGFKIDSTSIRTNDVAVTSNADNSIALSSADFTRTILSTSRSGLRFAIGDKFGITGDGILYTNGANITNIQAGNISAGNIDAERMQTNLITAMDAVVSDLQAINATIGGFAIDSTSIHTSGVAVTSSADNSVALSSADFTRTINDISRKGLRFAIGDKFGVAGDGSIYASEAVISGAITASSGYIGTSTAGFAIGSSSFYNGMTSLTDTTNNGVYIGTNGIALGKGSFKVTNGGALTTSNLKITSGNSYLAGNSTNNVNAFYWGTPTNFNVSFKGKYFINTSGNACFNSLYIGGHTVGNNWDEPPYYFTNAGNIKANSVTTNTISGTPVINGFYLHSNKDRGVYVTNDGYVSVYNNENRVQLSAGSGSNTYRIYAYCSSFYVNSTLVSSSDKKIKNHISYLTNDEKIEDFIMSLKPVSYTLKNGQSGRKHLGFYAQDVRDGAKKTIGDVGVYLASTLDMDDFENYNDDIPDEEISWGLRYDEFIAPLVALVQKQNKEIKDLQNRIEYLEKSNDL